MFSIDLRKRIVGARSLGRLALPRELILRFPQPVFQLRDRAAAPFEFRRFFRMATLRDGKSGRRALKLLDERLSIVLGCSVRMSR